ncbi:AhpC-TSA-domain-containing protein [Hysterangium stoloniferum]|nr:AhpC-TSA-domain-containing protein [Hysterangium stoloniferum]
MAPRKAADTTVERRRSTRIAVQPKAVEEKPASKPRVKKGSKKRVADAGDVAGKDGEPQAKKVKAISEEDNGEEQDELADDDDDGEIPATPKTLSIGDLLPSITLKNEKGEDVNVAELAAHKGLVLFLVPKADTPGCTKQACGFRDSYPDFEAHNFNVFCVSADAPTAQAKWQTKQSLPYSLLSDKDRVLIKALGAGEGNKTNRSHFIFTKGGKLVEKKLPVKPVDSPQQALAFVKSLQTPN